MCSGFQIAVLFGFRAKAGAEGVTRDPEGAAPGSYVAVHLADVPADVAMRLVQRVQAASQVPSLLTAIDSCWRRVTMSANRHMQTHVDYEHPIQLHDLHLCVMASVPCSLCCVSCCHASNSMLVIGCMTAWHTAQTCMPLLAGIQAGLRAYYMKSTMQRLLNLPRVDHRSQTFLLFGNMPGSRWGVLLQGSAAPLVAHGLLQHETKLSVLNFAVKKDSNFTETLPNKAELLFVTGLRSAHSMAHHH